MERDDASVVRVCACVWCVQELVAASAMMLQAIVVAIDSVPEPLCLLLHHVLRISYTKFPTER